MQRLKGMSITGIDPVGRVSPVVEQADIGALEGSGNGIPGRGIRLLGDPMGDVGVEYAPVRPADPVGPVALPVTSQKWLLWPVGKHLGRDIAGGP